MADDKKSEEVIDDGKEVKKEEVDLATLEVPDGAEIFTGEEKPVVEEKPKTVVLEEKKEAKKEEKDETDYKAQVDQLRKDKSDLKKALHEARQEKKKPKEEETPLTDAELLQIMTEHKDDPTIMLNTMKYMVKQQVNGVKKDAVNEVEINEKKKQYDTILHERYPEYDDEDSPIRKSSEKAKEIMNIKDHPFADTLGTAVTVFANLPNISKYWFEEGKKAAGDEKINTAREKQIADGKLTPPGSKSTVALKENSGELTDSQLETAKKFGFDKSPAKMKIYRSQILKVK